ncbi:hypothetical protein EFN19_07625 [Propionibacterium freudenreichii]|nr:hypothetical protein [Propionibacterium freudenreichii]
MGLLFAGRTLNTLGMSFAPVALSFGILGLPGGSASLLSIVLAAESIPLVLFCSSAVPWPIACRVSA